MYWFNFRPALICGLFVITALAACRPTVKENKIKFFDLQQYFASEASRMDKAKPTVNKTVVHNKDREQQNVQVKDWKRELDLFTSSAINKPAWQESYKADTSADFIIYRAVDAKLKTRQIIIKKNQDKVKYILIYNQTDNLLYKTNEKLTYFPDSLYQIDKIQQVKLLGKNTYQIKGILN
jgi:hypothetical protein